MKSKVAVLTATVLCIILFVFDTFIYLTLYNHLLNVEKGALISEANNISQYYVNNNEENQGPGQTSASAPEHTWIHRYAQAGQTIILAGPHKHLIFKYGNATAPKMLDNLQKQKWPNKVDITTIRHNSLFLTMPMIDPDAKAPVGYVIIFSNLPSVREYMNTLLTLLIIGSIGAVLLAALGGYITSAIAVRPINQMIRLVERIQVNRLSERLNVPPRHDEITRLASTFNSMLHRIERSFEQQARFITDASHEIRTPLTTIQGYANLLHRWGKRDPSILDKGLGVIQKESTRIRNLAEDLLTLASLEVTSKDLPRHASVNIIIEEIVEAIVTLHEQLDISTDLQTGLYADISSAHLKQILTNLIDNAIKYSISPASVSIFAISERGSVSIRVQDKGRGIPADDLPYIFDRFYRVDKSRGRRAGGTGLGLSIVKELVEAYGGEIEISSEQGEGTTITVALPEATE